MRLRVWSAMAGLLSCAAPTPVQLQLQDVPAAAQRVELRYYDGSASLKLGPLTQELGALPQTLRALTLDLPAATDLQALGLASGQVVALVRDAAGCLISSGVAKVVAGAQMVLPLLAEAQPRCGALPVLDGFAPTQVPRTGGAELRVRGAGFLPGDALAFTAAGGAAMAGVVSYVSPQELRVAAPALREGRPQAQLTVTRGAGVAGAAGVTVTAPSLLRGYDATPCLSAPVRTDQPAGEVLYRMIAGDIDGDGRDEILADLSSNFSGVFRLNAQGGLTRVGERLPGAPRALVDVTGDGRPDVVAVEAATNQVLVYPNQGPAAAAPYVVAQVIKSTVPKDGALAPSWGYGVIGVADANSDGRPDLYVHYADSAVTPTRVALRVLGNQGGSFSGFLDSRTACDLDPRATPFTLAELDGEGADVLYAGAGYDQLREAVTTLSLRKGLCQGVRTQSFPVARGDVSRFYDWFVAADLDGDGDVDVVAGSQAKALVVLLNDGVGHLSGVGQVDVPFSANRHWVEDMNGDGLPEAIAISVTYNDRYRLALHHNLGGGRFASAAGADPLCGGVLDLDIGRIDTALPAPEEPVFGDFDGDGRKDVILSVSTPLPDVPQGIFYYRGRGE